MRPAERSRLRSEAARKGWVTRRFRVFEDPQLPLPMKSGAGKRKKRGRP